MNKRKLENIRTDDMLIPGLSMFSPGYFVSMSNSRTSVDEDERTLFC